MQAVVSLTARVERRLNKRAIRDAGGLATPECTTEADGQSGEACNMGTCGPPVISETCLSANTAPLVRSVTVGAASPPEVAGDGDCPVGFACVDGACLTGCTGDQDCPSGQLCQGGACVVDEGACVDNLDCAANEACIGGRCEASEQCAMNADCPPGQICENERCTEQVSGCRDDSECGPNADCIDGACVAGGPCADCPEDTRCVNDMCVPIERCNGDGDCPAGQVCSAGECVPEGGGGGLPCGRDEDLATVCLYQR